MYKSPAYLQNLVGLEGSNEATDYLRYQNEIARQRAELEARRRHNASFGQRAIRGLGGALKGGLMGAMTGNPYVAAGAAAAGFAGGALDDGNGGTGAQIGQNIGALGAMGSMAAGKYLSGSPAAVTASPNPYGEAESLMRSGEISPAQYKDFLEQQRLYQSGGLAGPGF